MEWPRVGFKPLYMGFTYFNVKNKNSYFIAILAPVVNGTRNACIRCYRQVTSCRHVFLCYFSVYSENKLFDYKM